MDVCDLSVVGHRVRTMWKPGLMRPTDPFKFSRAEMGELDVVRNTARPINQPRASAPATYDRSTDVQGVARRSSRDRTAASCGHDLAQQQAKSPRFRKLPSSEIGTWFT